MRLARRALLVAGPLALPALAGCAPDRIAAALTPGSGYALRQDLAYGPHPRQRLDLYTPDGMRDDAPVVLFLHGGAWRAGSKDQHRFVGEALCSRGMAAVVANYRLFPEVRFPAFVEDAALATAWMDGQGRDVLPHGRRVLAGHSAGAYIAVLLALDPRWLAAAGAARPAGAIGLAGPYEFPLRGRFFSMVFGAPEDPAVTQPMAFAATPGPPLLLQHGLADTVVRPEQSERLAAHRRAAGQPVRLATYPDLSHIAIIGALLAPVRWYAPPVLGDIEAFVTALG